METGHNPSTDSPPPPSSPPPSTATGLDIVTDSDSVLTDTQRVADQIEAIRDRS